jgi:peptide/nickel transport system permease protein
MRYILRRLAFYLVTAWAALSLNFIIPRLMPGNPVSLALARFSGKVSPNDAHAIALLYGITNQGLGYEYVHYFTQILTGRLGVSFTYYPASVASVIMASLPWTVVLIGVSTIVSFTIGTGLGIVIGWRRGSWMDGLLPASTVLSAIPYFWLGLITVYVFGEVLGWFPVSGGKTPGVITGFSWTFITSALDHGILPFITIVVSSLAGWMLGMRNMMITTLGEPYVTMAQAKGLSRRRVMLIYAARNAIIPSLASFALALGFVVGGAILVEIVFSYPGIGYALYQAVTNEDYPLMQGIFLVITIAVLVANLLADVVYVLLDPRVRELE